MLKNSRVKTQAGFSLIELMIVVAIIGVLAAIAVPNFQRFQAKSRQSEAKGYLSGVYTGQKAFNAEWQFYYGDLRDIGFRPEGTMNYIVGQAANYAGAVPANFIPSTQGGAAGTCLNSRAAAYCNNGVWGVLAPAAFQGNAAGGGCAAAMAPTQTAFVASANGFTNSSNIAAGNAGQDVWAINETKTVCNTQQML